MFTGIIEDTGTIAALRPEGEGRRLAIRCALPLAEVGLGDSIAVDGACLTVESVAGDTFEVVAGQETLALTTLGRVAPGRRVHLERALAVGARLDGHLVQGHVDGLGTVVSSEEASETWVLWIDTGEALARYVARKGSLCVDGVSLTVNEVDGTRCRLNIIPHTARVTRLASLEPGDAVNLEVDVLARYVERMLGLGGGGLTWDKLREHGFG
ncbi:MAG: riboflavin synthase [Alphaproteobacteria bacterium]|nr:riboflavin synthase [Alphaproteobacteria bacterium]